MCTKIARSNYAYESHFILLFCNFLASRSFQMFTCPLFEIRLLLLSTVLLGGFQSSLGALTSTEHLVFPGISSANAVNTPQTCTKRSTYTVFQRAHYCQKGQWHLELGWKSIRRSTSFPVSWANSAYASWIGDSCKLTAYSWWNWPGNSFHN